MAPHKNPAAVALGRLGGRAATPAKASAARANGAKGGRPRRSDACEQIAGHQANVVRVGGQPVEAAVLLGSASEPGHRAKDPGAREIRLAARKAVAAALGLDLRKVTAAARYSSLAVEDGSVVRRGPNGTVIGVHAP